VRAGAIVRQGVINGSRHFLLPFSFCLINFGQAGGGLYSGNKDLNNIKLQRVSKTPDSDFFGFLLAENSTARVYSD
jgi:hypothetical protein